MKDLDEKLKQLEEKWDNIAKSTSIPYVSYDSINCPRILGEGWIDKILAEIEEENATGEF